MKVWRLSAPPLLFLCPFSFHLSPLTKANATEHDVAMLMAFISEKENHEFYDVELPDRFGIP